MNRVENLPSRVTIYCKFCRKTSDTIEPDSPKPLIFLLLAFYY